MSFPDPGLFGVGPWGAPPPLEGQAPAGFTINGSGGSTIILPVVLPSGAGSDIIVEPGFMLDGSAGSVLICTAATISAGSNLGPVVPPGGGAARAGSAWWWWFGPGALVSEFEMLLLPIDEENPNGE